ncbi:tetratricopeptide repeat protein [Saccharospirillum impatiens]|uniref:tetratricopeptide repeat protein n=1 Tax=Saccharospirillum impatiens TaxID=169438 RepID=UPI0004264144|nr:tetratricopeptide repeat protein [Saccharospirillum impatiens]
MGFAGVGAIMLTLVLIVYLRSISKRPTSKDRARRTDRWLLDQVDALEGFGRHQDAIRLLQRALESDPENQALKARLALLEED